MMFVIVQTIVLGWEVQVPVVTNISVHFSKKEEKNKYLFEIKHFYLFCENLGLWFAYMAPIDTKAL